MSVIFVWKNLPIIDPGSNMFGFESCPAPHRIGLAFMIDGYESSHHELRRHLQLFINTYSHARRFKAMRGLAPYECVNQQGAEELKRSKVNPLNYTPAANS